MPGRALDNFLLQRPCQLVNRLGILSEKQNAAEQH